MKIIDFSKKISYLGVISALLGYVLSFYQIYLFHLVSGIFVLYIFLHIKKIDKLSFDVTKPILFFILYSLFTLLWVPSVEVGFRNLFYLVCGYFCVFFVVYYSSNFYYLKAIYKLIVFILCLNFLIGFMETLGFLRLPMSPYSPYAHYFGYSQKDLNDVASYALNSVIQRPTGFNGNPNNFGFVYAIGLPFLFFYNKFLKFISIFLLIWFNLYIQSRGLFLATIIFFIGFIVLDYKKNLKPLIISAPLFIIWALYFNNIDLSNYRFFNVFDSISVGWDQIKSGQRLDPQNSTDFRSYIYGLGLYHFINNPWFGLGIGGIQSVLIDLNFDIQSFHFYFLEVLIDYGFIFYFLFLFYYLNIIKKLLIIAKNGSNNLANYAKSSALSLIILPFASIAPSSIVYILSAWIILGLSIAIIKLDEKCSM